MPANLSLLIVLQMGIDVVVIVAVVVLLYRLRRTDVNSDPAAGVDNLASVLTQAHQVSGKFKEQLAEKQILAKNITEKLDGKIQSLNFLLNRADRILGDAADENRPLPPRKVPDRHRQQIFEMAESGKDPVDIARQLSVPKEEVRLVLDMKRRMSRQRTATSPAGGSSSGR